MNVDPPGYCIVASCACPKGTLHVVRCGDDVRIDWILGRHFVKDIRNCLQCAMPLRVERRAASAEGKRARAV